MKQGRVLIKTLINPTNISQRWGFNRTCWRWPGGDGWKSGTVPGKLFGTNHLHHFLSSLVLLKKTLQVYCPECGEDVACKEKLPIHLKTAHNYSKPFLCDPPCDKAFKTRQHLVDHQSRKNCLRTQSFQCQLCGDQFGIETGLTEHLRRGKCQKKYQCLECENTPYFSKLFDFNNHKQITHAEVESGPSENNFSKQLPLVIRYVR